MLPDSEQEQIFKKSKCYNLFLRGGKIYIPVCPILESSQPQLSKSPILQFLVSVCITPAALIAWTNDVSLVAVKKKEKEKCVNLNVMNAVEAISMESQRSQNT